MRGDQLTRQWRVIQAIEASPDGLTVAEIAKRDETGIRTMYRALEAFQPNCHPKAQSAPREIFRILLSFLNILLTPSYSMNKTIMCFPAIPPSRPRRLGVSMYPASGAVGRICDLWPISCASSHAFGVTLLEGGACSSRLKAAPQAEQSALCARDMFKKSIKRGLL